MRRLCMLMIAATLHVAAVAEPARQALCDILEKHHTYEATFSGHMRDPGEEGVQLLAGHLAFQRPGLFAWLQEEPDAMTLIADGKRIWSYDPVLEQVIVKPQNKIISDTPVALLAGDTARWIQNFEVGQLSAKDCRYTECFYLKPDKIESTFVTLQMHFKHGVLAEIQFQDVFERHTQLQFADMIVNHPINPKVFIFKAPEGVDVLEAD